VTESRVSQLRSEALEMLREGITAQYQQDEDQAAPAGRVAKRKANYALAIAGASQWRSRLSPASGPAIDHATGALDGPTCEGRPAVGPTALGLTG
jgi:RNA polymerase sigma factor for flagellar operon FliA